MTYDDSYWARQAKRLDVSDDVRHTDFARFVHDHCGNTLVYAENIGWYRWNGRVWEATSDDAAAMQAVTDASEVLIHRMRAAEGDRRWAGSAISKMLVNFHRTGIVREMRSLREFRVPIDAMDERRYLLTFRNGTVDLRTGELRPHDPADMLTQCAQVDYNPDAVAPRWLRFVEEVFPGDADLQRYYQTWLGLCVTGEARDHVLGVWYGEKGRNGKGTTIRTMQSVFGHELVLDVPFSLFEKTRNEPHTELIASLRTARMVVAQEGNAGVPMDTARLKNYTGGDRINARHLRGKTFTFAPKFTLVLATNELPEFASGGAALWARTKAILFGQSFAGRVDRELEPTIQGPEREGVAAWIVEGAKRYYAEGLVDPVSVELATEHHKDEVDPLKPLIDELFTFDDSAEPVKRSLFNEELKKWRDVNGDTSAKFKPQSVSRELERNGVKAVKRGGTFVYAGIRLMPEFGGPVQYDDSNSPELFQR
ncbi:DNA primase family protein [Streptomyces lycii]|uniref:SF3 helicase domain-containing protein n=1 Tax=Streptomyces lycii TaxID=2654337 RepID=A0ABQ7FSC3_9ACTN|nr:DNA primase family protein [Streptomyces lycii]KAF4410914.1 hypothetical protein GCU69_01455 [Streptomyces lycii]